MLSREKSLTPSHTRDQIRTIARATFSGFLQSDLMPQGMQAAAVIWVAAFLLAPGLFLPVAALNKYATIRRFFPERMESVLWNDRMLFLIMSAGAIGLVAVVLWDTLFPARRDAFVLTPLPVPLSAQMLGRLAGLLVLCGSFVVALNLLPTLLFPISSAGGFAEMPRRMIAHAVTTSAADVSVFFSVTSLQGLVILAIGRRFAARIASFAQAGAVLVLLLSLLFISGIVQLAHGAFVRGDISDPVLRFLPPMWFMGLYEVLAGTKRAVMTPLALWAVVATVVPVAVTGAIYAFGYKRLLVRAVETPPRSTRSWIMRLASSAVRLLWIRRPEEQAIAAFLLRAISRSSRHSMLMSIYVGAGLAMMVTFVLPDILRFGSSALAKPSLAVMALPLVLSVGLAVGVRILMTIPAEMPARWIFQTSAITPRGADAATHKALLLIVVPPVALTAALTAGALWDPALGLAHAVFCSALATLLCEALLLRYRALPLTRAYVPGGSRFHMLWAAYFSIFLTYTFTSVALERDLWRWYGARGVLDASAVFAGFAFLAWARRKYVLKDVEAVSFDAEEPEDQMFQGFNLSEIQAAQAVATHRTPDR
jgi:hypothetical protein